MSERGRPNNREVILAAAKEQFLAHGFAETSVDAVVAAAGVSKPTVYAHFPTKEALLEAVVRTEAERAEPPVTFEVTHDPRTDLERVAGMLLMMAMAPEALAWDRMMAGEARRLPALGQLFHEHGPELVLAKLADFFRMLDQAGGISVVNPEQAADFFFGLIVGAPLLRAQLTGQVLSKSEREKRAKAAAELLIRAFAPDRLTDRATRKK